MKLFRVNKIRFITILIAAILFVGFFLLSILIPRGYLQGGGFDYLVTLIIASLLLLWGISMIYRIQFKKQKLLITLLVVTIFMWMIIKYVKWLPNIRFLNIYIDYVYYVPALMIIDLFFILMLETFYENLHIKKIIYIILVTLSLAFVLLVFTNDLHHLFYTNYKFHTGENEKVETVTSSYGPLYYVYLAFVLLIAIAVVLIFAFGSKKQLSFKQFIFPVLLSVVLVIYISLYILRIPFIRQWIIFKDFSLMCSLFAISILESFLDIGLIQNNGHYQKNFSESFLAMTIYDEDNYPLFKSFGSDLIADLNEVKITEKSIGNYKLKLVEDISAIKKLQNKIIKENDNIKTANKTLAGLIEINKQQASISYRLNLINEIEKSIGKSKEQALNLINSLPDEINPDNSGETRKKLAMIAWLISYMKQKCMVLLEAKEKKNIDYESFEILLNVISIDLASIGFNNVGYNYSSKDDLSIDFVISVIDLVNKVATSYAYKNIEMLIATNSTQNACRICLFDTSLDIKDIKLDGLDIKTTLNEDGLNIKMEKKYE